MAFMVSSSFTSPSFKFNHVQQTVWPLFLTSWILCFSFYWLLESMASCTEFIELCDSKFEIKQREWYQNACFINYCAVFVNVDECSECETMLSPWACQESSNSYYVLYLYFSLIIFLAHGLLDFLSNSIIIPVTCSLNLGMSSIGWSLTSWWNL